jgi:rhodanese-related sulfurtransferase
MNIISTTQELQSKSQNLQENEILLDVRTPEEFCQGHISGAVNLDICRPDIVQEIKRLNPSKTYIVYCKSGGRSKIASLLMEKQGFHVINSTVGMMHWIKDNLPYEAS